MIIGRMYHPLEESLNLVCYIIRAKYFIHISNGCHFT